MVGFAICKLYNISQIVSTLLPGRNRLEADKANDAGKMTSKELVGEI